MCFAPQRRAIFEPLIFKKWPESVVFASRHSGVPFLALKMAPRLWCFVHFDWQMCLAPQRRSIFRHQNFKKCSENVVFCAFWLQNVLFSENVVFCAFWLAKCAWCHSGVPLFRIATSKMAPTLRCFEHFDLQMCFPPQRRAIFHLSAEQLPPHPPLWQGYFLNIRNHESLKNHSDSRPR